MLDCVVDTAVVRAAGRPARLGVSVFVVGAVLVGVGACASTQSSVAAPTVTSTVPRASLTTMSRALGPASTVRDQGTIEFGGRTRTYLVHVPVRLTSPRALVINLHGGGGVAAGQQRISGYDTVADANGFIVVYPQGVSKNWADGRGATEPDRLRIDDVGFISALIDKLRAAYDINPRWVFATGLSNGAFMAQRLGCDLAGKIAAIAPVAGTLGTGVHCAPALPVSMIEVHGTNDPLVPFNGGEMTGRGGTSTIISVSHSVARWRKSNGCMTQSVRSQLPDNGDGTSVTKTLWSGCNRRTAVVLYTVTGGGHTWPGGLQYLPEAIIGKTTTQFSASQTSWAFFRSHPRR